MSKFPPSNKKPFTKCFTDSSWGISYPDGDLCRSFTKLTGSSVIDYTVIRYPQQMVQMPFCDLLHTFHKQVTNVSQHVFVILLRGISTSPLNISAHSTTLPSPKGALTCDLLPLPPPPPVIMEILSLLLG